MRQKKPHAVMKELEEATYTEGLKQTTAIVVFINGRRVDVLLLSRNHVKSIIALILNDQII